MSYGSVLVIYESTLETSGVDPNLFLGGEIFSRTQGGANLRPEWRGLKGRKPGGGGICYAFCTMQY